MSTVIAIAGDLHCGSTIGLCPATGIELDDGGWYDPSEAQLWLWEEWEKHWKVVQSLARKNTLHLVLNGDLIDGDHHRTSQIASPLTGIHIRTAMESLAVPLGLKPKQIHVVRGTPTHVGRSAESEEGIARALHNQGWPIEQDPDTGMYSSYRRRLDIGDVRLDIAHHGRMGQRANTRRSYSALYAFDVWAENALEMWQEMKRGDVQKAWDEKRPPDLGIRSHNHQYMDSGYDHRGVTRMIACPAFQLATEWVHRIAAENMASIGILVIIISDDGQIEVKPLLSEVSRTTPIKGKQ